MSLTVRDRTRRWGAAVLLIAGAEGGLLVAADLVLRAASGLHASLFALVGTAGSSLASVLPAEYVASLGVLLGALGAPWFRTHLLAPALTGASGAGLPALGGVLAAPVYTVLRRTLRAGAEGEPSGVRGASPRRICVAARPTGAEPPAPVSPALDGPP